MQNQREEEGGDIVLMQNHRIKGSKVGTRRDCVVFLVSFRCNIIFDSLCKRLGHAINYVAMRL